MCVFNYLPGPPSTAIFGSVFVLLSIFISFSFSSFSSLSDLKEVIDDVCNEIVPL